MRRQMWHAGTARAGSSRMPACIEGRNVNLTFRPPNRGPVRALQSFDIDVEEGEFLSIVGPSGCGKSTFLNVLLGLIKPDSGDLRMRGKPIAGPGTDRAMVFQEFGLLPWRTVQQQYRARARTEKSAGGKAPRRCRAADRSGRPLRLRGALSARIVGRHEAARRACPRARHRSGRVADGRAVRGARRADARPDAGRVAAHLAARRARPCCSSPIRSTRRSISPTASW